jgi:acetylornithine deacetylase/succinyl-diaminopimelate desuccinylase-like protein
MDAVRAAWDQEPILKPTLGGSVPTAYFSEYLDVPVVMVPYANRDENNHSPDENLSLECFRKGIRTTIRVLERMAAMDGGTDETDETD